MRVSFTGMMPQMCWWSGVVPPASVQRLKRGEQGADVLVLDRSEGGGATELSGGVVYAGGGTSIQQSVGEEDTPERMFKYLKLETGDVVSDETLRRFCESSADNIAWLMGHGVRFSGPVWKQKTSYPGVDYFLYHSDNSLLPAYRQVSEPAARGHRGVIKKGRSATNLGGSIIRPLIDSARRLGVEIVTRSEVLQLVTDTEGQVLGVKILQIPKNSDADRRYTRYLKRAERIARYYPAFLPGGKWARQWSKRNFAKAKAIEEHEREARFVRARRGVVLAAGGFIFNRRMVEFYCPKFRPGMPMGTRADDGAGIRLGQSVGGKVGRMNHGTAWRFINPPAAWSQGIVVNGTGARFVNESSYGATIGDAMVRQDDAKAWLILDKHLVKAAWRQCLFGGLLTFQWQLGVLNMLFGKRQYPSVAVMANALGFHEQTLRNTLADYNRVAVGEMQDPFSKAPDDSRRLMPPFYVIDVSLGARFLPCTVMTMGGLVPNERTGQVRHVEGGVVQGLFVAGRTAVGIPSNLYISGLSLADCVFSGRRAGAHASRLTV